VFVTRVGPVTTFGQVPDVRVSSFAFSAVAFAASPASAASTSFSGGGSNERYVEVVEVPSGGRLVDAIVAWAAS
jgi:hypothetical protein